ncbi:MAG: DUF2314 domain-containing protein [Cyanobacteria bacterium P01_G01_bin.54]
MSQPDIYFAENCDSALQQASDRARSTFKYFWRELSWEYRRIIPGLDLAAVKLPFVNPHPHPDAPDVEQMWIDQIDFDGHNISGRLINEPQWIDSAHPGDTVTVPFAQMTDWLYAIAGNVYGAHTVNALRVQMTPQEQAEHDAAWGLEFGNPQKIKISPYFEADAIEHPEMLPEHPMSENMAERIEQMLINNPEIATSIDESGWSLLHREALAGNLTPVRLLLAQGADPDLKNSQGDSARDFAQRMGWPKICQCFNV